MCPTSSHTVWRLPVSGIGQTKIVEDGINELLLAAHTQSSKRLGAREKWRALHRSPVLNPLHRMPKLDEKPCLSQLKWSGVASSLTP